MQHPQNIRVIPRVTPQLEILYQGEGETGTGFVYTIIVVAYIYDIFNSYVIGVTRLIPYNLEVRYISVTKQINL